MNCFEIRRCTDLCATPIHLHASCVFPCLQCSILALSRSWRAQSYSPTSPGVFVPSLLLSSHIVGDKLHWTEVLFDGRLFPTLFQGLQAVTVWWRYLVFHLHPVNPSDPDPGVWHPHQLAFRNPQRGCTCELRVNNSVKWQGALVSNVKCPLSNKFITHEYVLRDQRNDYAGDLWSAPGWTLSPASVYPPSQGGQLMLESSGVKVSSEPCT